METSEIEKIAYWGEEGRIFYGENNFKKAIKYYNKILKLAPDDFASLTNKAWALLHLKRNDESIEYFDKVVKYAPNITFAWNNYGWALLYLQRYEDAINCYDKVLTIEPNDIAAWIYKSFAFYKLERDKEAIECFNKSDRYILDILTRTRVNIIPLDEKYQYFHFLFDNIYDLDSEKFFKEITNSVKESDKEKYKQVYMISLSIISKLYVSDTTVAHYTTRKNSLNMLCEDSAFRLNSITNSNDPKEGVTLLDYVFNGSKFENSATNEYITFVGSFSFNHNNLTMFRLYGKENDCEGTGVSIVLNNSFFSKDIKQSTASMSNERDIEEKYTLFRCIYIDPNSKRAIAIGHNEKENMDETSKYVNHELIELIRQVVGLDRNVVGRLLLNLRYLTKHYAFKEEQECRIIKVCPINAQNVHTSDDYKHLYIDYLKIRSQVEKIYLGSKFADAALYHNILRTKSIDIKIEPSRMPLR
jgi:tetratricopeptide (TPR) repeat protein